MQIGRNVKQIYRLKWVRRQFRQNFLAAGIEQAASDISA
jgi:hypothetical protein